MFAARILAVLVVLTVPLVRPVDARDATPRQTYQVELAPAGSASVRLYAEEWGQGPPILLIHGLGMSTFTWRHIAPRLAETHRVIAIDLKGFGRSDKPFDRAYSARDQAELVAAFIEHRHLEQVTLVGHSFGGTVALLTAVEMKTRAPGRVARLVLIDAPTLPQNFSDATLLASAPLLPYGFLATTPPEIVVRLALGLARAPGHPPSEEDIRGYAAPLYDLGARHALIQTAQGILANETKAWVKAYRRADQPALLIWCRSDRVVPAATGRRLVRVLPNARLKLLSRCNHVPQDEKPEALLSALQEFLQ
jgi:pimeloyl-ACP methyl ester carboxylesterase